MEYVNGFTLRQIFNACQRHNIKIPASIVAEIGRQSCEGLAHAHAAKTPDGDDIELIHRDIKPANIMVDMTGVVKIVDFGVSVSGVTKDTDNMDSTIAGT